MPKIVRPEDCQPARTLWYDRKKYVTINFMVQNPKDVQVDVQDTKIILSCKDVDDNNIYNEIEFYDRVFKSPAWLLVDFDNWRDWEHEEEDGRAEYDQYMDMLNEMKNKGEPPAMDDLDDLQDCAIFQQLRQPTKVTPRFRPNGPVSLCEYVCVWKDLC
ncbi:Prostaglandin E synthase 3 [Anabarilius grahami]|uniref:Prostaglandin E synthase 3 n=1 Tax=Anabarilius grahami TaxID=495550 RepID=A0A3N0Z623_ANAGA|nr:Prostaglandin E synthase 3 [Anabarilius grahami]